MPSGVIRKSSDIQDLLIMVLIYSSFYPAKQHGLEKPEVCVYILKLYAAKMASLKCRFLSVGQSILHMLRKEIAG